MVRSVPHDHAEINPRFSEADTKAMLIFRPHLEPPREKEESAKKVTYFGKAYVHTSNYIRGIGELKHINTKNIEENIQGYSRAAHTSVPVQSGVVNTKNTLQNDQIVECLCGRSGCGVSRW